MSGLVSQASASDACPTSMQLSEGTIFYLGDDTAARPKKSKAQRLKCSFCDRTFDRALSLNSHRKWAHEAKLKCSVCGAQFIKRTALKRHLQSTGHEQKSYFQCDLCERKFAKSKDLQLHQAQHRMTVNYQCSKCLKKFVTKSLMTRHIKLLCPDATEIIEQKLVPAKSITEMRANILRESESPEVSKPPSVPETVEATPETFICSFCELALKDGEDLLKHEITHLSCHLCPSARVSTFKSLRQMRKHFQVTHGYFLCHWCHLIFAEQKGLVEHFNSEHAIDDRPEPQNMTAEQLIIEVLEKKARYDNASFDYIIEEIEKRHPFLYLHATFEWKSAIQEELDTNPRFASHYVKPTCRKKVYSFEVGGGHNNVVVYDTPVVLMCSLCNEFFTDQALLDQHLQEMQCTLMRHAMQTDEGQVDVPNTVLEDVTGKDVKHAMPGQNTHNGSRPSSPFEALHEVVVESEVTVKKPPSGTCSKDGFLYKCPFCAEFCSTVRSLKDHVFNDCRRLPATPPTDSLLMCHFCPSFAWCSDMLQHIRRVHEKHVSCTVCLKSDLSSLKNLRKHFRLVHAGREFECAVCLFDGGSEKERLEHYRKTGHSEPTHAPPKGDRENFCDLCQVAFAEKSLLELHNKSDVHPYCEICEFTFETPSQLISHFQQLSTEDGSHRDLFCSVCANVAPSIEWAVQHSAFHSQKNAESREKAEGDRDEDRLRQTEKFEISRTEVVQQPPLKTLEFLRKLMPDDTWIRSAGQSQPRQTAQKPKKKFQCKFCSYVCPSIMDLRHHARARHSNLICDFKCDRCGKACISKAFLERHKKQHCL